MNSVTATLVAGSITVETDSMKEPNNINIETGSGVNKCGTESCLQEPLIHDESYVFRSLGDYKVEVPKIISQLTP